MLGVASAHAGPGAFRRDGRDAVRAYHIQSVNLERTLPQEAPYQPQPEQRQRPASGMAESSGDGASGDGQSAQQAQQAESARRAGRMSPEERRRLRRQIDEVGHDIYAPKR